MSRGGVSRSYLWRMHAFAWLWAQAVVIEADPSPRPSADAMLRAREGVKRLLDLALEPRRKHTIDRWFGPSRPRDLAADSPISEDLADEVESAIRRGLDREQASRFKLQLRGTKAAQGSVDEETPSGKRVFVALEALRAPSRVEELLAQVPDLGPVPESWFSTLHHDLVTAPTPAGTFDTWDDALPTINALAAAPDLAERHVRVLGLTLGRAWDYFTHTMVTKIRAAFPDDPVHVDLLQLDPEAGVTGEHNPDWPDHIRHMRSRIAREARQESTRGVHIAFREYARPVSVTGVAVGGSFVGTFVGFARPARPTQGRYFLVNRRDQGAAGMLHEHCESCWSLAWAGSTPVDLG